MNSDLPDKSIYRSAINRFYEGIGTMPGTTKQIDTARVVEQSQNISGN